MPVPRGEDEACALGELLHWLGDLVALGHGERATGGEVVLKVDDQQGLSHVLTVLGGLETMLLAGSRHPYGRGRRSPCVSWSVSPGCGEGPTQARPTAPPRRGSP